MMVLSIILLAQIIQWIALVKFVKLSVDHFFPFRVKGIPRRLLVHIVNKSASLGMTY